MDRRTFLTTATSVVGACGLGVAAVPFLRSLQPAQDIIEAGITEVDISGIGVGEVRTVLWRQQPVFILHRSPQMIASAKKIDPAGLRDPATPEDRVKRPEWLVCLGVCTHLGCVPDLRPDGVPGFDQPGFLCPCHGGEYDSLGRRLAGPPPENLHLLPYEFVGNTKLRLGTKAFPGFSADVRKIQDLPSR
ncbi:MAG: ubiquinol-cytochrome c reductase iron-sulfur subunit [Proteobacteria bacterium]|nr:ubiquinol-cytochrome c reductase iron-sulfur subunit [Pseudomonadota bacterium]